MGPSPPGLDGEVLTTGPPGKSQQDAFCNLPNRRLAQWEERKTGRLGSWTHAVAPSPAVTGRCSHPETLVWLGCVNQTCQHRRPWPVLCTQLLLFWKGPPGTSDYLIRRPGGLTTSSEGQTSLFSFIRLSGHNLNLKV